MGGTGPSKNALHKTKQTKSSIFSYGIGLDEGWTNLLLRARFFGRAILFVRPIGHAEKTGAQNQTQCGRNN